jgi:predicted O-methyltransferase YrrM
MSRGFRGHASEAPRLALSPTLPGLRTFLNSVPGMIDIDRCIFHFVLGLGQAVDGDIVEIGSWQGRNTVALAAACRASGNGRVWAIDHFEGNPGSRNYYVIGKEDLSDLKSGFESNIARSALQDWVILFDQPRQGFDQEVQVRLLFIDGNHDLPSVRGDLEHFLPLLVRRAIVIFDDYSPEFPGVVAVADEFIASGRVASSFQLGRSLVVLTT